ncbi:MAG: RluA family pseudouridine synthase [Myxococcota bacterium]
MTPPTAPEDGESRSVQVPEDAAGRRLDVFLASWLGASRSQARRLLARGGVRLDGRVLGAADKGAFLAAGQRLEARGFRRPEEEWIRPQPDSEPFALPVLVRGEGFWVVDKPAGRPVHPLEPDETGSVLNVVVGWSPELRGVGEGGLRSGVVHRLDVETSGALCVATREAQWQALRAAFRERRVTKRYRALVAGVPDAGLLGRHEVAIRVARHRPARVRVAPADALAAHPGARLAALEIESIERFPDAAELVVRLETGFLHQIRATLAGLGHPVLGDSAYGGARPGVPRPMLHAALLAWNGHRAEAPPPDDYLAVRRRLAG